MVSGSLGTKPMLLHTPKMVTGSVRLYIQALNIVNLTLNCLATFLASSIALHFRLSPTSSSSSLSFAEDLSVHPFLANPSIQASGTYVLEWGFSFSKVRGEPSYLNVLPPTVVGYLMMAPSPPRAKSSPVPIRRHTPSPSRTPYSSRHSHSPVSSCIHTVVFLVFSRESSPKDGKLPALSRCTHASKNLFWRTFCSKL